LYENSEQVIFISEGEDSTFVSLTTTSGLGQLGYDREP